MKKYTLFYSSAGSSGYETVVFKAKSLNDAFSYAKHWCKISNKELLGILNTYAFPNYL